MRVSVILPALNEAGNIRRVLAGIPPGAADEIIVVDGGSTDGTPQAASEAGARVVSELRRGYGQACAAGVAAATGDILVFMDADGADDPAEFPRLTRPLLRHEADLVLGSRLAEGRGAAMLWHQRAGNALAAWLFRRLYGLPLTDLSPFRAVRRDALLGLGMREMTYGWPTEMIAKATRRGLRIVELAVSHRPRLSGRSKISGTLRGTLGAAWYILSTILRYRFLK